MTSTGITSGNRQRSVHEKTTRRKPVERRRLRPLLGQVELPHRWAPHAALDSLPDGLRRPAPTWRCSDLASLIFCRPNVQITGCVVQSFATSLCATAEGLHRTVAAVPALRLRGLASLALISSSRHPCSISNGGTTRPLEFAALVGAGTLAGRIARPTEACVGARIRRGRGGRSSA
jgi:hypothetical protein